MAHEVGKSVALREYLHKEHRRIPQPRMTKRAKRIVMLWLLLALSTIVIINFPAKQQRLLQSPSNWQLHKHEFDVQTPRTKRSIQAAVRLTWWQKALCDFHNTSLDIGPYHRHFPQLYRDITPKTKDYNIFLSETACNSHPNYRAWCSVESWARQNPGAKVWYVLSSPATEDSDRLVKDLQNHYENLHIVGADLDKMFSKTPVWELFKSGNWTRNTPWPQSNLSNLIRNVMVWLWGGFYSDTDTICIKNITNLHNVIAYQFYSDSSTNNALMHFENGHHYIYKIMEYLKDNFKIATWHVNGPGAATDVLKEMCNITDLDAVLNGTIKCEGVTLLPEDMMQPIPHQLWRYHFKDGYGYKFEEKLKSVYVLHTWSSLSRHEPIKMGKNSIYDVAARTYCPITYKRAGQRSIFF